MHSNGNIPHLCFSASSSFSSRRGSCCFSAVFSCCFSGCMLFHYYLILFNIKKKKKTIRKVCLDQFFPSSGGRSGASLFWSALFALKSRLFEFWGRPSNNLAKRSICLSCGNVRGALCIFPVLPKLIIFSLSHQMQKKKFPVLEIKMHHW